jgi:hypothetical protein
LRRFAERKESASNADEVWRKLCVAT